MTLEQINQYLMAPHIYGDVTDEEYATLIQLQNNFMTFVGEIRYCGVEVAIDALKDKEIVA